MGLSVDQMRSRKWWVYVLVDPRSRQPFYVGVTTDPLGRWYGHHRNGPAKPILLELHSLRLKCHVRIAAQGLAYDDALALEQSLITKYQHTVLNRIGHPGLAWFAPVGQCPCCDQVRSKNGHRTRAYRERRAKQKGGAS